MHEGTRRHEEIVTTDYTDFTVVNHELARIITDLVSRREAKVYKYMRIYLYTALRVKFLRHGFTQISLLLTTN
jgi:hypothetical protein